MPASKSTRGHRSAHTSPRRKPVVITSPHEDTEVLVDLEGSLDKARCL
jgi:hypothetical protein